MLNHFCLFVLKIIVILQNKKTSLNLSQQSYSDEFHVSELNRFLVVRHRDIDSFFSRLVVRALCQTPRRRSQHDAFRWRVVFSPSSYQLSPDGWEPVDLFLSMLCLSLALQRYRLSLYHSRCLHLDWAKFAPFRRYHADARRIVVAPVWFRRLTCKCWFLS